MTDRGLPCNINTEYCLGKKKYIYIYIPLFRHKHTFLPCPQGNFSYFNEEYFIKIINNYKNSFIIVYIKIK